MFRIALIFLVVFSAFSAPAAHAQRGEDATTQILRILEKQREERRLERERLEKYPPVIEQDNRDTRGVREPDAARDPRNPSASEAYPGLRNRADDINQRQVCDINPLSACMASMDAALAACSQTGAACASRYSPEDPSCKAYSCEMEKASCMQGVYASYSSCLAAGRSPEAVETIQPLRY